jgi:hypothetical protein
MVRTRLGYRLVVTAILSLAALIAAPAAAVAQETSFRATITGNAHLTPTEDPLVLRNDETGKGVANHIGQFSWADVEYVNFGVVPGGVVVVATFTMTFDDGDQLFGELATVGILDENAATLFVHGTYEFTGGTGRFSGATGSGEIDAVATLAGPLPFAGRMNGTINY